jgi:hypothetical protein
MCQTGWNRCMTKTHRNLDANSKIEENRSLNILENCCSAIMANGTGCIIALAVYQSENSRCQQFSHYESTVAARYHGRSFASPTWYQCGCCQTFHSRFPPKSTTCIGEFHQSCISVDNKPKAPKIYN